MQLEIRIEDTDSITFGLQFQPTDANGSALGPELIAATVTDSQLSNLRQTQVIDIVNQLVGYFEASGEAQKPAADWAADFRDQCR